MNHQNRRGCCDKCGIRLDTCFRVNIRPNGTYWVECHKCMGLPDRGHGLRTEKESSDDGQLAGVSRAGVLTGGPG